MESKRKHHFSHQKILLQIFSQLQSSYLKALQPLGKTGFTFLASETHSPYVDNRPLLVAGEPETRQYKAVFFTGKTELDEPSDVAVVIAAP